MLLEGDKHGGNFLRPDIFQYAKFRCRDKRNVETIEEFRLFNNMLSSQPMCFNLFVPLRASVRRGDKYVNRVFQKLFPGLNIERIVNVEIEYVPVPIEEYIDDKSAFDAFVEFRTKDGRKGCIAIETKYVDSLGKNDPTRMDKKLPIAREIGCFTATGLERIKTKCPQIVRNFLLVEKYRLNHGFASSHSIVLALDEDKEADKEIKDFRTLLRPAFQSKMVKVSLQDFVDAIQEHSPSKQQPWIKDFRKRYLDMKTAAQFVEAVVRGVVGA